ncbi:UNVERIFIED_CONTAM: hypothetical protein K2H54_043821 [Gekko kuhli]
MITLDSLASSARRPARCQAVWIQITFEEIWMPSNAPQEIDPMKGTVGTQQGKVSIAEVSWAPDLMEPVYSSWRGLVATVSMGASNKEVEWF